VEEESFLWFFKKDVVKKVQKLTHVQLGHGFLRVFAYEIANKLQTFIGDHVRNGGCQRVLSLLLARELQDWSVNLGQQQILVDTMKDEIQKRVYLIELCIKTPSLFDLEYWRGKDGIIKVLGEINTILKKILQEWLFYKAQESLNLGFREVHRMIQSGIISSAIEAYFRMRPDEVTAPPLIETARGKESSKPCGIVGDIFHAFNTDGIVKSALLNVKNEEEVSAPFPRVDTETGRAQMEQYLGHPYCLLEDLCSSVQDHFPRNDNIGWTKEKQLEMATGWLENLSCLTSLAGAVGFMKSVQEMSDIGGDLLLAEGAEQKDVSQIMQACKDWLEVTLAKTVKLRELQDHYNTKILETGKQGWIWNSSRPKDLRQADIYHETATNDFKNSLAQLDELQSKVQSLNREELVTKRRNACSNLRIITKRLFRRFDGLGNFTTDQAEKEDEELPSKAASAEENLQKKVRKVVQKEEKQDKYQPCKKAGAETIQEEQKQHVVRWEETHDEEPPCKYAGVERIQEKSQQLPKLISIQGKDSIIDGEYALSDDSHNDHHTWKKLTEPAMTLYSNDWREWAIAKSGEEKEEQSYMFTEAHHGRPPIGLSWYQRKRATHELLHAVSCQEVKEDVEVSCDDEYVGVRANMEDASPSTRQVHVLRIDNVRSSARLWPRRKEFRPYVQFLYGGTNKQTETVVTKSRCAKFDEKIILDDFRPEDANRLQIKVYDARRCTGRLRGNPLIGETELDLAGVDRDERLPVILKRNGREQATLILTFHLVRC